MKNLKRCSRCKENFLLDQLHSDKRLYPADKELFCVPCLIDTCIENVAVCRYCNTRFVFYRKDANEWLHTCAGCRIDYVGYIYQHIVRARQAGTPATLTDNEWKSTVKDFKGYCAYCLVRPFDVLEHFIPIGLGGGSEKSNCVPACQSCNRKKSHHHPTDVISKFDRGTIERVQNYLQQFK